MYQLADKKAKLTEARDSGRKELEKCRKELRKEHDHRREAENALLNTQQSLQQLRHDSEIQLRDLKTGHEKEIVKLREHERRKFITAAASVTAAAAASAPAAAAAASCVPVVSNGLTNTTHESATKSAKSGGTNDDGRPTISLRRSRPSQAREASPDPSNGRANKGSGYGSEATPSPRRSKAGGSGPLSPQGLPSPSGLSTEANDRAQSNGTVEMDMKIAAFKGFLEGLHDQAREEVLH